LDTKQLKNIYLNTNETIEEEEKRVENDPNLFFGCSNLFKMYGKFYGTKKIALRNISFGLSK